MQLLVAYYDRLTRELDAKNKTLTDFKLDAINGNLHRYQAMSALNDRNYARALNDIEERRIMANDVGDPISRHSLVEQIYQANIRYQTKLVRWVEVQRHHLVVALTATSNERDDVMRTINTLKIEMAL